MRSLCRAAIFCAWISLLLAAATTDAKAGRRVQSHSMIHLCCTPYQEQAALLEAAKASGARIVRLDVEMQGIVTPSPSGYAYDFTRLDSLVALARRTHVRILAVLQGTPSGMTACPPGTLPMASWKCPTAEPEAYAAMAVRVMARASAGVVAWEFWNEPDLQYMYLGTAEQYGHTLGALHRHADGRFRITNGGVAGSRTGLPFLRRAIAAGARFDVGNIHLRGSHLRARAKAASAFFGRRPLWVTEHGYPSRPDAATQARYLSRSIPALRAGGADQVFVTLRDSDEFGPDSPFASEGIVDKPAWDVIRHLNGLSAHLSATS